MLKILWPYIALYRRFFFSIILGLFLIILALGTSLFLLSLSGWFLAISAFVGIAGLYTFNYMLPATGIRATAILRTVSRYFERLVNHNITFKILAFLRVKAFKKLLPLTPEQLSKYDQGDLLNRFIADIDQLDHIYLRLFAPVVSALFITAFIYFGLSFFNSQVALLFALILLCAILILPLVFYHLGQNLGKVLAQQKANYRQKLVAYLSGQAELILFNAEESKREELNKIEQQWFHLQKKQTQLIALASVFVVLISGSLILCSFVFLNDFFPESSKSLIALFVFVGLASSELLTPIATAFIFLGQVIESAKRMTDLYHKQPAVYYPEKNKSNQMDISSIELTLNHLSFSYPDFMSKKILNDISLTINMGEKIALIGESGMGKSTLFKLLLREYPSQKESILFNQIPIDEFDEATFRTLISVVPQTIDLFSDTLRNNLLIAAPSASDEQLVEILAQVNLDKLLTEKSLDLKIGDQGRMLSGGERRRIGIARCLLKKAPLILLDEPTESLDQLNANEMMALFKDIHTAKTIIMITHKIDSLTDFDHIFELKNGQLELVS